MENKILVTGGHGLVGSEFLGGHYYKPYSKDYDLRNPKDTNNLMLKQFDSVIHCAAKVGGLGANMAEPANFFEDNILMNSKLILMG